MEHVITDLTYHGKGDKLSQKHGTESEGTMQQFISNSETETEQLGSRLAAALPQTAVICLYGELGAGKTAFVRGLAEGMGLDCTVSSPTFTIVNEYLGNRDLIHFDMYRLGSADELFDIGWEDYLKRKAVLVVEWSENVQDAFDGSEICIHFKKLSDTVRLITLEGITLC